ncbi:MAG TPA: 6,7-dimethyl-8-ribityllumazine synthase [Gaiella sp.]|nr:6,7-dimethyl-8-ribityllumazine synthase [Gaiella sp.]
MSRIEEDDARQPDEGLGWDPEDGELERASENVLEVWPAAPAGDPDDEAKEPPPFDTVVEPPPFEPPGEVVEPEPSSVANDEGLPGSDELPAGPAEPDAPEAATAAATAEHAAGELTIPPGYAVLEGEARGGRRAVGIVVSRFNGEVTGALLDAALAELDARGVDTASITVMPVPGAFELPLAAMALAKTRRFACIVALGCVIRGDTPHFDYVAGEAASGLQLAAIETGVPVAFGVLTLDSADQAEARLDKGAEAVRTALEMADIFSNLRAAAAR